MINGNEQSFMEWLLTVDLQGMWGWITAVILGAEKLCYMIMKTVRDIIDTYKEMFKNDGNG